jgi:hypothetical protein
VCLPTCLPSHGLADDCQERATVMEIVKNYISFFNTWNASQYWER